MKSQLSITINGHAYKVAPGISVAAALAQQRHGVTRLSVNGMPRAPLCGMGICQECRVQIDGRDHQLACQTMCVEGMNIRTGDAS